MIDGSNALHYAAGLRLQIDGYLSLFYRLPQRTPTMPRTPSAPPEVWVEGEKIPDGRLADIFRPPPGAPPSFVRSSLIIGARGVGKTVLLRHHKETHRGVAVSVALAVELASITKQTGNGPLASDYSGERERLIASKATSLLAVSIAERLIRKGVGVTGDVMNSCLPRDLRVARTEVLLSDINELREKVAEAPVRDFSGLDQRRALPEYVSSLASAAQATSGPLLLLLDKADMVPTPALIPVLELLDQSAEYVVLVALRPGHGGYAMSRQDDVTAGDHYAISHLGTDPRSTEWRSFVESAVKAQLGAHYQRIPSDVRDLVITLSRESVRNALEIFARYLSASEGDANKELEAALEDSRQNMLHAAQSTLQRFHPNFGGMVRRLRVEALEKRGKLDGPVQLSINNQAHADLFGTPSAFNSFVEMALRTGAVSMPEGARWMPGATPSLIEIPPILTWEKGDPAWPSLQPEPIVLHQTETRALSAGGGAPKPPHIFVAFRFRVPASAKFRRELEEAMKLHKVLSQVIVEDGRVPHGNPWADTVRERIGRARLVVGDVSGVTCEVMFELGFAYGLGKNSIPVVASGTALEAMPRWLTATQTARFGGDHDIQDLLGSVLIQLGEKRQQKPRQAIPAYAVWMRSQDWNRHALEQATTTAGRYGLKIECFDPGESEERIIQRAAQASLLIASLDGTAGDALAHYVSGAIVARPKVSRLSRKILLIDRPGRADGSWAADSLRRCTDTVSLLRLDDVAPAVRVFGEQYLKWSTSKDTVE